MDNVKPTLLVLKNFQSLRERTEIPIRALTFFYGPNSAGKSCISDALKLMDTVISGGIDEIGLDAILNRWIHQAGLENTPSCAMSIELHCDMDEILFAPWSFTAGFESYEYIESLLQLLEKSNRKIKIGLEFDVSSSWIIFIEFGSERIVEALIYYPGFENNDVLKISKVAFDSVLKLLSSRHALILNEDQKFYEIECSCIPSNQIFFKTPMKFSKSDEEENIDSFDREVLVLMNAFFQDIAGIKISPTQVDAERRIINNDQLNCICSSTGDRVSFSHTLKIPKIFTNSPSIELNSENPLSHTEPNPFHPLAHSAFDKVHMARNVDGYLNTQTKYATFAAFASKIEGEFSDKESNKKSEKEELIDYVNRCLIDFLFIDQGYQIIFDALEIKPATNIEIKPMSAALMAGFLVDKNGRKLMPQDVGSGISCVIPVLLALYGSYSFIQQPELHLHPALQSSLADVFIESVRFRNSNHFIETHSEYILLRCLRRIRETTAGRHSVDKSLALTPEDMSVLYFEPQPEGYTRVKSIRISKQGDFIDRWPRGFFEERGKEVFDE